MTNDKTNNVNISFSPPDITEEEIQAVIEVLKSGWLSLGNRTIQFEREFANYIGSKDAVSVNSCTSGLFLSLNALGIGKGDEVITTPFTFASTANVIIHNGAKPVFADIEEEYFNISCQEIEKKITDNTKAIVVVHIGGQPANMKDIMRIAENYKLQVIEDAAHAVGGEFEPKRKIGSLGNLTCFSFYATKPMTTGEGGMITLNDTEIGEKLRIMRLHGISKDAWKRYLEKNSWQYDVIQAGFKCNTTDISSAIGLVQLKRLDTMNQRRKEIAQYYSEYLKDFNVILPNFNPRLNSSYHLYPIRLMNSDRDNFIREMANKGIGTSVHFIPLHMMSFYKEKYGYRKGDFPVAEKVYESIVSLPIYPQLTADQMEYIMKSAGEILR